MPNASITAQNIVKVLFLNAVYAVKKGNSFIYKNATTLNVKANASLCYSSAKQYGK
jgi:hypothetical protein